MARVVAVVVEGVPGARGIRVVRPSAMAPARPPS